MAEKYTTIEVLIDRLMRHPLMQDVSEESIVDYVIEFLRLTKVPANFCDKVEELEVRDYMAPLPCDFESIIQVMPDKGLSMVESADSYFMDKDRNKTHKTPSKSVFIGNSYRIQGHYIHFSFEREKVKLSYRAIATDNNGIPLIPEDTNLLLALEWYIKVQVFTILVDLGRLPQEVLQRAEQQYCWYVGKYQSSTKMDSLGKAEKLLNSYTTLIERRHEFQNGFRRSADKEIFRIH